MDRTISNEKEDEKLLNVNLYFVCLFFHILFESNVIFVLLGNDTKGMLLFTPSNNVLFLLVH